MRSRNTNLASVQHKEILTRRVKASEEREQRKAGALGLQSRVTLCLAGQKSVMIDGSIGQEEVRIQTDPDSASHRLPRPLCVSVSSSKNNESKNVSEKRCCKTRRSFKDTVTFLEIVENIVRLPSVIGEDCTPGQQGL